MHELHQLPQGYWEDPVRAEYFEILQFGYNNSPSATGNYILLIPLFRTVPVSTSDKTGYLLKFKRSYLEEDDKEYALDIFQLFNDEGQQSSLILDTEVAGRLQRTHTMMLEECRNPLGTYLILKALLKVYLLNLVRVRQKAFLLQDVNQKRVYEFIMLLNEHYLQERKAGFYASQLGITEKRLNQILIEKMHKTVTQQLHMRLILEAKRLIIASNLTIKEIAWQLNFEDRGYFTRFFKKQTGMTPEAFKETNRYI